MLKEFQNHINLKFPYLKENKILLATSGGLDSMVLCFVFNQLNYNILIAHCNFQLRGDESNSDEIFVENYAKTNKITFFSIKFQTEEYAKLNQKSIQIAARELRYNWFNKIATREKIPFIATAHHADDNLETFIINLSRGTGIEGLNGIPEVNQNIIRPLLPFSRQEIENFAKENNILWREDSSNASDKYLRNAIRHKIVPQLKELNDDFLQNFNKTQHFLQQTASLIEDAANFQFEKVTQTEQNDIYFDVLQINNLKNKEAYLYQWFFKYGFTAWQDIADLLTAQTGKKVVSKTHILLKNRNFLILSEIKNEDFQPIIIENINSNDKFPLKLTFQQEMDNENNHKNIIFADQTKIKFPLTIRKWKEGDVFYPFGMNGSKKVSKFFKDEKLSMIEKQAIFILESDNKIVWIINYRADARFVNTSKKLNKLKLEYLNNEENI